MFQHVQSVRPHQRSRQDETHHARDAQSGEQRAEQDDEQDDGEHLHRVAEGKLNVEQVCHRVGLDE